MTKMVSTAGLRCPPKPPTIESPNIAAPKGPCTPSRETTLVHAKDQSTLPRNVIVAPQTHVASPPGGLPNLPAKRPKERLPKEERDSTTY
jgi:hypothetical protein